MAVMEQDKATLELDLEQFDDDFQKLDYLVHLYLSGHIELDEFQREVKPLQTQPDFRKIAEERMADSGIMRFFRRH